MSLIWSPEDGASTGGEVAQVQVQVRKNSRSPSARTVAHHRPALTAFLFVGAASGSQKTQSVFWGPHCLRPVAASDAVDRGRGHRMSTVAARRRCREHSPDGLSNEKAPKESADEGPPTEAASSPRLPPIVTL